MTASPKPYMLTDQQCDDIITTAIEGGLNYWAGVTAYRWEDQPAEVGTVAMIVDNEDEAHPEFVVDREVVRKGWALLYTAEWLHLFNHYGEINLFEDGEIDVDANGADNIVQLGVFGTVIYG
jgi:hypothetical protein